MKKDGTFRSRILEQYDSFSTQEKKIAKFLADHYTQILTLSGKEIAQLSGVSESAVVRFAQSMGFSGFRQLKNALKEEKGAFRSPYAAAKVFSEKADDETIRAYHDTIAKDLKCFTENLDMKRLDEAAEKIQKAGTVFLIGIGSDCVVAEYLANYLPLLGIRTIKVCRQGLAMKESLLQICEGDYILMSVYPNVQEDEKWVCDYAAEHQTDLFLITDSDLTAEELNVQNYIVARNSTETFYHSYVLSMMLCDILLMKIRAADPAKAELALKKYDELISC